MEFFDYTDDEIYALACPIIERMNEAANSCNYELFSTNFSQQMLDLVGEAKFNMQMNKNIPEKGDLGSYTLLGCVRRESGVTVVYKQATKKSRGELLAQLLLDKEDDEIKVFYAGIQ